MSLCCQKDDRRDLVRQNEKWNGLDYVEVGSDQTTLNVTFLGKLPKQLTTKSTSATPYLTITGGTRITGINILTVTPYVNPDPTIDDLLVLTVDRAGDFSDYSLNVVGIATMDPFYASATFNFKIDCPSDLDCAPVCNCQPPTFPEPDINYLAKDFASFRQLILDRLAVIMPLWQETHTADIGIALVEVLAYVGDYLSYYQDAVATESYLPTANQRISVRRHVRLVDYHLNEGCNARAWICFNTAEDLTLPVADVFFITGFNDALSMPQTILYPQSLAAIPSADYEVFEPLLLEQATNLNLKAAHSTIQFYTWGQKECCVESGSTQADLLDQWISAKKRALSLNVGDVLIFEEVIGPKTGNPSDADPTRRCAVRLTQVTPGTDQVITDADGRPTPYVTVTWSVLDALPFTFCVSTIGPAPGCLYLENISVARGNVILVDNGQTQPPQGLGTVPILESNTCCECAEEPGDVQVVPGTFRATLANTPITYVEPLPSEDLQTGSIASATALLQQDVTQALPQIWLSSTPSEPWSVVYDLIESWPNDWTFVVEIDDNSMAHLRFGDGVLGAQPPGGMSFSAAYRIGSGSSGNVGQESISRLVLKNEKLTGVNVTVRNPLPAQGGTDPGSIDQVKLLAPNMFLSQIERAVTAQDYVTIADRNSSIQGAAASLNWNGSWYEADVAIDPLGTETAAPSLIKQIQCYLEPFRMMGQDLRVEPAVYVPIKLTLGVCVCSDYQAGHVNAAILQVLGTGTLTSGQPAFFNPNNLTFGQALYLTQIIAVVQAVPGVESVWAIQFHRLYQSPNGEIQQGFLPLATNEIAQLDDDPNYPEHGQLKLQLQGGM